MRRNYLTGELFLTFNNLVSCCGVSGVPRLRCNFFFLLASSCSRVHESVHRQIESARPRKFNLCQLPPHCNEDASLLIAYMVPPNELMHLLLLFLPPADINECERDPCKNGGICTDLVANYSCECPGEYMGRNCQSSKCSSTSFTTLFFFFSLSYTPALCAGSSPKER